MPGGRPKGSTSALAARASRRNLMGGRKKPTTGDKDRRSDRQLRGDRKWEDMANRREEARLAREEAQAIREQARAREESGELCVRSEATSEVQRIHRIVRAELDRVTAYLDPGIAPAVRAACEEALTTMTKKLRNVIADKVEAAGAQ
jgi:hypothetical protein